MFSIIKITYTYYYNTVHYTDCTETYIQTQPIQMFIRLIIMTS